MNLNSSEVIITISALALWFITFCALRYCAQTLLYVALSTIITYKAISYYGTNTSIFLQSGSMSTKTTSMITTIISSIKGLLKMPF